MTLIIGLVNHCLNSIYLNHSTIVYYFTRNNGGYDTGPSSMREKQNV